MNAPPLASAYAHCGASLRAGALDPWLAALFAPAAARPHLHALWLFEHELASLRDKIRQPMAGEIRLQYWRDILAGQPHGDATGNPLAMALLDTIETCHLPRAAFLTLLDARVFDVYDDPMPDVATLEGYGGETSAAILRLASLILAGGTDPGGAGAAGHAGMALAITRILADLPRTSARGQVLLPADILASAGIGPGDIVARRDSAGLRAALAQLRAMARDHARKAQAEMGLNRALIAPAFLGLPVAELYLRAMDTSGYLPFDTFVNVPQWRRQWAMWRM